MTVPLATYEERINHAYRRLVVLTEAFQQPGGELGFDDEEAAEEFYAAAYEQLHELAQELEPLTHPPFAVANWEPGAAEKAGA